MSLSPEIIVVGSADVLIEAEGNTGRVLWLDPMAPRGLRAGHARMEVSQEPGRPWFRPQAIGTTETPLTEFSWPTSV